MSESTNGSQSRRAFLSGAALTAVTVAAAACNGLKDPFSTQAEDQQVAPTGEKVKLLSVNGEVIEVDKAFLKPVPHMPSVSNSEARIGIPGKKFVMVIDLARCKNLKHCQASCNHMHHIQDGQNWIKVQKMKESAYTAPYWQPTTCMHCDEPPCVKVCPVDATFKRQDGIVLIDSDRCIGCRFCMAACPYSTRVFNWNEPVLPEEIAETPYSPETSVPQKKGTVGKCDFCPDMTRQGELPHCVSACPNGVFFFGDLNEDSVTNGAETFRFSDLVRDKAGYRLMEDLGTKPNVYYLPPVNRNFPIEAGEENDKG
ncbi:prokaryotic molybdopterin-containing oxidoreductase family, iron-sulfur binding subunit [Chitinophaga costaii]|uniref:Prokaryotic molybdopterin-containing oxidoreductase family, iron-sulfur binding subunit n=1 Tax=Chitinophaga costaii TaxID=1335309 RepID=A0A1C4CWD3_9BACT|nr:4Fe-4S dicluster domain-containing protein [Chitinophaga costaii]PUZ26917.1 4Fe-4S dicluster domain-containing protein [Chitinophaga costaii]SCC23371.1 prokaryotic molybdopterin-containing oxidoreductase family, iron-sulfur binding subunit [Chitinophaga costaii]